MVTRIVKMVFKKEHIENFKHLFEERKEKIRAFPGCEYLELLQGMGAKDNVFFTYSYWKSEDDLDNYRYSDLFKETWSKTKIMFEQKAEATSLTKIQKLP